MLFSTTSAVTIAFTAEIVQLVQQLAQRIEILHADKVLVGNSLLVPNSIGSLAMSAITRIRLIWQNWRSEERRVGKECA